MKSRLNRILSGIIIVLLTICVVLGILFTILQFRDGVKKNDSNETSDNISDINPNAGGAADITDEANSSSAVSQDEAAYQGSFGSFSAEAFDGSSVTEKMLEGFELNLINVWATFCSPCIQEMPELEELSEEYAGKVQFIGICCDVTDWEGNINNDLLAKGKTIIDENLHITYPQIIPSKEMQSGILADVYAVPTTYICDGQGNIYEIIVGRQSKSQFGKILDKYLK